MDTAVARYRPEMTRSGLAPTCTVIATDEYGDARESAIAGEFPLTIYVDRIEVVTLMTLGTHPEALTLGYLRNQRLVSALEEIVSIQVDWDVQAVAVTTRGGIEDWDEKLGRRTVTTGCGQGTMFGRVMEDLEGLRLAQRPLRQSTVYALLKNLNDYNEVYKNAGAVHGCALCRDAEILVFIEDVGRHNAVDAIAGMMWLDAVAGEDKLFYTTGRLTSEMVIKVAQMRIPALLSRSGITKMGLDLAQQIGVTLIARAKGRHFLVYAGRENVIYDERPARPAARTA